LEELEALLQAVGQLHVAAVPPEFALALGLVVMDYEKIADALVLEGQLPVVAIDVRLPKMTIREELQQQHDAALDELNAGRFEWLEKPCGQPDRDTVLVPGQPTPSRREPQRIARSARRSRALQTR
jgi:hypothetical protein